VSAFKFCCWNSSVRGSILLNCFGRNLRNKSKFC
jgi:hypothetical protein